MACETANVLHAKQRWIPEISGEIVHQWSFRVYARTTIWAASPQVL